MHLHLDAGMEAVPGESGVTGEMKRETRQPGGKDSGHEIPKSQDFSRSLVA